MTIIINLLNESAFAPILPASWLGWLGWLVLLGALAWSVWVWRGYNAPFQKRYWLTLAVLAALTPVTSLFFGLYLPGGSLPMPGFPQEQFSPALMFFSAVPWVLAAGMLGPLAGAVMGAFAGLFAFFWNTHSIFTPLEFAFLGSLFAVAARQRYRTMFYSILRQPFLLANGLALLYPLIYLWGAFFASVGTVAVRLDYAISSIFSVSLSVWGELFIAGIIAQVIAMLFPELWRRTLPLEPSPAEKSLQTRFLFIAGLLIAILLATILAVNWLFSGRAARQMLFERMQGIAETAGQGVPYFLETGQNLILLMVDDPIFSEGSSQQVQVFLKDRMLVMPYFTQMIAFDDQGQYFTSYPGSAAGDVALTPEELSALELARDGVRIQIYTIPSAIPGGPARISFIAAPPVGTASPRILVGRTDLTSNPLSLPFINGLENAIALGGVGMLVDENKLVTYHPQPTMVMTEYGGDTPDTPTAYIQTAPDGTREMVYYQPVEGRPWSVIITVPAQTAQQLALDIAAPLSGMIILLAIIAMLALYFGLDFITVSLKSLTSEAVQIAMGHLDRPLLVEGVDEVGQLRRSFEQMRGSLKMRLDELDKLLLVSQGVASSLNLKDAALPILEAVLATGASSVRIVEEPVEILSRNSLPVSFGVGPASEKYAHLDPQIMELVQKRELLVFPYVSRARGAGFDQAKPQPISMLAIALRHENQFYGVLWAGYDQHRNFSDPDVRYFTTLAGYASLAATNAHLFLSAEIGRQRLAAILASTPDPVLVTDSQNRLLLANPAAWQTLGPQVGHGEGQNIEELISQRTLLDILEVTSPDKLSAEVQFPTGQTYLAMASPVAAEGQLVGRVCILRDVTYFKELDSMKSDFVSTVSHDLRSPLTLMRGYATMLELVGNLNEQQQTYVTKIIVGVESMTRLVNNLLDLGRIEAGVGLQLENVSIAEIVDRVTGTLQAGAAEKEIELRVEIVPDPALEAEADPALLHQAVYNLVENAIKYTPAHGKVFVRAHQMAGFVQVEVQDTGIGIPPAEISRLFEKFFRSAQREARQQKGTGLGLAIVRSIAERHGGKVWVESELGQGSIFYLRVPTLQKHAQ